MLQFCEQFDKHNRKKEPHCKLQNTKKCLTKVPFASCIPDAYILTNNSPGRAGLSHGIEGVWGGRGKRSGGMDVCVVVSVRVNVW